MESSPRLQIASLLRLQISESSALSVWCKFAISYWLALFSIVNYGLGKSDLAKIDYVKTDLAKTADKAVYSMEVRNQLLACPFQNSQLSAWQDYSLQISESSAPSIRWKFAIDCWLAYFSIVSYWLGKITENYAKTYPIKILLFSKYWRFESRSTAQIGMIGHESK